MLARFLRAYYYQVFFHDDTINTPHVRFSRKGRHLIAQYYQEKYKTNISFHNNFIDFTPALRRFLSENHEENYRQAFYIGDNGTHAMAIIYIADKGKKAFLCADSLGDKIGRVIENGTEIQTVGSSKIAKETIKNITDIPVYTVSEQSLADAYSCVVHTLILARDCTGESLTPDLLEQLASRQTESGGSIETKLPDKLLKLSQISLFTRSHQQNQNDVIHYHNNSPETLDMFLARYKINNKNHYMRIKGLKFTDMIEIQFYINELKKILKDKWTEELHATFISQAKNELNKQWNIALNFNRTGLHFFTSQFIQQVNHTRVIKESRTSFFEPPPTFQVFATQLFTILKSKNYWSGKTFWRFGLDDSISRMQKKLLELEQENQTVVGKFNALRKIAWEELSQKSFIYLFTSFNLDMRHEKVTEFLSFFINNLHLSIPALTTMKKEFDIFEKEAARAINTRATTYVRPLRISSI